MRKESPQTPLIWIALGQILGQIAAPHTPGEAFPAAATVTSLAGLWLAFVNKRAKKPTNLALCVAIAAFGASLGHLALARNLRPKLPPNHIANHSGRDAEVRATVIGPNAWRPAGRRLNLYIDEIHRQGDWIQSSGRVLLTVRDAQASWQPGDRFSGRIRLREPRNFGNPGEFDYKSFLARRRIYRTAFALSDTSWQRLPRRRARTWSESTRQDARVAIEKTAPPGLRPIAAALLLGDSASIPPGNTPALRSRRG